MSVAITSRLLQLAVTIGGPVVVSTLRKAAQDPQTRQQVTSILAQVRSGMGEATPAARARSRLRRDLDALVSLARSRRATARDTEEEALADGWVREAEDIRGAVDIADGLSATERRSLVTRLEQRRLDLLRRMLSATLHDDGGGGSEGTDDPTTG